MKMGEIVTALPALQKLANEKLTLKTLYQVSHTMSLLDKEIDFYNQERMKIIESLGNNVEGDKWQIPKENMEEYQTRMEELINLEIASEIKPILLPTSENLQMSYNDIKALDGFVSLDFVDS